MTAQHKRKTTKIDYTLEQFLQEQQRATRVTNALEKISNVLDKLDKRISKLEKKKYLGVWTLHPRRCATCNHRWHYFSKCHKRLNKFRWQSRVECDCKCSKALSIKEAIQYARSI